MDIINLLPDSIANQIAAGEVVQRPASVVKELLENSVDAGATDILLNVREGGKAFIQVVDNGKGMSSTDARLCFERHATSKIHDAHDLESIVTMGFRGEALASIAAVAEITLLTQRKEDTLGTRITLAGSEVVEETPCPSAVGSNFTVRNLFYNVPARRRFLKSVSVEMKHIISEFQRIAIANPQIAMSLHNDNTKLYVLPATNRYKRIVNLFGKRMEKSLVPIKVETETVAIEGYIGKPESARKRGGEQFFYVNGRYMRNPYLARAVLNAYDKLIPADATPIYFIHFTLDPGSIDVNIHPTKTEVKFEDERLLWQILHACVREALGKFGGVPLIDFSPDIMRDLPFYPKSAPITKPELNVDNSYNPFTEGDVYVPRRKANDWYQPQPVTPSNISSSIGQDTCSVVRQESLLEQQPYQSSDFSVIQFNASYLITPISSGLAIIDQHRAHARILFEKLKESTLSPATAQQLLFPVKIQLSPDKIIDVEHFLPEAAKIGLMAKIQDNQQVILYALPLGVQVTNPEEFFLTLLEQHAAEEESILEESTTKALIPIAFASAIQRGVPLTSIEAQRLVQQLFSCQEPALDPRKNPTMHIVEPETITSWLGVYKR